jgi:hypothetical protein
MPANERYHLNVLLDNQRLARPSPPVLVAQAKLIQDYHWSPGAVIDSGRSRRTYRTVVTALNPDRTRRGGERIEVWATDRLDVEVDGHVCPLGPYNSQTFVADGHGELTLVVAAESLTVPRLSLCAGFMDRGARYVIDPAEDAHASLASLDEHEISDPGRMTNWRTDAEGGPAHGALLKEAQRPHAAAIATSVRNVMAVAPGSPPPRPLAPALVGDMPLGLPDGSPMGFPDMTQPVAPPRSDVVRAVPTMDHQDGARPVTPEGLVAALQQAAPGSRGFTIRFGDDGAGVRLEHLTSDADVAAAMGTPTAPVAADVPLGGVLDFDWWDDVKHGLTQGTSAIASGVTTAIDKVKEIAITVGDAVTVAIHTLDDVTHVVLRTVEDAVDLVVAVLKKIALEVWEIIQFLMLLFDWGAILEAHRIIKALVTGCVDRAADVAANLGAAGDELVDALDRLLGGPGRTTSADDVTACSAADLLAADGRGDHPAVGSVNGVSGGMLQAKLKEHAGDAHVTSAPAAVPSLDGLAALQSAAAVPADVLSHLLDMLPQLASGNIADIGDALLALLRTLATDVLSGAVKAVTASAQVLTTIAQAALRALDATLDIPFLGALYRWITGDDLSIMDLTCLVVAVPVHIAYAAVTGRRFADDARDLPDQIRPAQLLGGIFEDQPPPYPMDWAQGDSQAKEIVYVIFRALNIGSVLMTDVLFFRDTDKQLRAFFKVMRGASGIIASTLAFTCGTPFYINGLARRLGDEFEVSNKVMPFTTHAQIMYALGLVGDLVPLATGGKELLVPGGAGGRLQAWADLAECGLLVLRAYAMAAVIGLDIAKMNVGPQYRSSKDSTIYLPARYLAVNDMLLCIARIPAFLFTETGRREIAANNPYVYGIAIGVRFASLTAGLTLYAIAEFDYVIPYSLPAEDEHGA